MEPHVLEHLGADDWARGRAIRLRALASDPDAFGSTLAREQAFGEAEWRARLGSPEARTYVVRGAEGDGGLVVGARYGEDAGLFSMWVAPEARGQGIGALLVQRVVGWARRTGYPRLLLDVADANEPAIRLYRSQGFVPTGVTGICGDRPEIPEHQLALELAPRP
ncbi:MAG: GNAT family N-acetyltransferase [Planctomycetota bacterium]|nr:GNAT family N-acetyltransferase [Planctomycetota bacterium]